MTSGQCKDIAGFLRSIYGQPGMNGWMICDFTSFSTVFQLYQDDGRLCAMGPWYGNVQLKDAIPWHSCGSFHDSF